MRTKTNFFNRGQSPFTTRKAELDYFPEKVNVRVTSRLFKQLDLRELGNFMKIRPP